MTHFNLVSCKNPILKMIFTRTRGYDFNILWGDHNSTHNIVSLQFGLCISILLTLRRWHRIQYWKFSIRITSYNKITEEIKARESIEIESTYLISNIWIFTFFYLFTYFFNVCLFLREGEREREREIGTECEQGRGRERGRQNSLQALSCQHRAWCRTWAHEPGDHDLSWSRMLNRLSHPDTPYILLD